MDSLSERDSAGIVERLRILIERQGRGANLAIAPSFAKQIAAHIEAQAMELVRVRLALSKLERAATGVSAQGAKTGSQWFRLTTTLIEARAALVTKP